MQHLFKQIAVFRAVYGVAVRADDVHPAAVQPAGEIYGCLTAERGYNAHGLFKVDDVHDILLAQRLKVQLVGAGVVR